MRCFVALAIVAGCGDAHLSGPCSETFACDEGAVCDLGADGGPECVPSNGDTDADGILNSADFCLHAPGGLYDEDGDKIGDDCDPCPIAAPPATPDPDGDQVDSPCDPDPRAAGDVIVAFSGFQELPATWTPTAAASWQILGGELVVTAPDATTQQRLAIPLAKLSSQVSVLARWRVDGLATGAATFEVGVAARDRRPAGIAQFQCGAVRDSIGDHLRVDTNSSTMSQLMPNLFDTAGLYRVAGSLNGANVGCALIADNSQAAVQASITPDAMSEVDLVARAATARFSYVLVVAYDPSAAP